MTNSRGGWAVLWPVFWAMSCAQPPPPPPRVEPPPRTGVAIKCSPPDAPVPAAPSKTSPAQDNAVTLDGVPPLPDQLRQRMNQYLNTRGAEFTDWATQGPGMLIQTRFGETVQVHRVAKPLRQREQLTFFPEPVKESSYVPGAQDRSVLLYLDSGGAENYQLAQLNLANGRSTRLTDGRSRTGSYLWSRKGLLTYSNNARNGRDFDIYLMRSLGTSEPQLVQEVQGDWTPLDFSPDEKRLLLLEYISQNETYLHQLDLETGTLTPLTPRAGQPHPAALGGAGRRRPLRPPGDRAAGQRPGHHRARAELAAGARGARRPAEPGLLLGTVRQAPPGDVPGGSPGRVISRKVGRCSAEKRDTKWRVAREIPLPQWCRALAAPQLAHPSGKRIEPG